MLLFKKRINYIHKLKSLYPMHSEIQFKSNNIFEASTKLLPSIYGIDATDGCPSKRLLSIPAVYSKNIRGGFSSNFIGVCRTKYLSQDTFDKLYDIYLSKILSDLGIKDVSEIGDFFRISKSLNGWELKFATGNTESAIVNNFIQSLRIVSIIPVIRTRNNVGSVHPLDIEYEVGAEVIPKEIGRSTCLCGSDVKASGYIEVFTIGTDYFLKINETCNLDDIIYYEEKENLPDFIKPFESQYGSFWYSWEFLPAFKQPYISFDEDSNTVTTYLLINLSQLNKDDWRYMYRLLLE